MSLGGGSKSGGTTTTVEKADPWVGQQPFLTEGFNRALTALNSTPQNLYQGPVQAASNPAVRQAMNTQLSNAQALTGIGDDYMTMARDTAAGRYLDPATNPALQGAITAALRPGQQQLLEVALPAVRDSSLASGYYGGSRQGVAQAQAIRAAQQSADDTAAKMVYQNYATERGNQLNAAKTLQDAITLQNLPTDLQINAGQNLQALDQEGINAILAQQQYGQSAPFVALEPYMNLVRGNYGSSATGTTTAPGQSRLSSAITGGVQGALGGGMGAAAMASLGMALPGPGWAYALGGAGLGLLGGLL